MKATIIIVNVLGIALFGLFAWFQINDNSDPEIYEAPSTFDVIAWTCVYAYVAVLFGIGSFKKVPIAMLTIGVLACVLGMSFTAPGIWANATSGNFTIAGEGMQASAPEVEQSREFLGSCIALIGIAALAFQRRLWNSKGMRSKTDSPLTAMQ